MTAHPAPFLRPGATRAEVDLLLPAYNRPQLEALLHSIQRRLGSPEEIPGDIECAQLIVHRLNNLIQAEQARELLRELDELDTLEGGASEAGC